MSGPYAEMLSNLFLPRQAEDGTFLFVAPLGNGHIPLVALDDLGWYARWMFDHPKESSGKQIDVAIDDVAWADLARTFTEVTTSSPFVSFQGLTEFTNRSLENRLAMSITLSEIGPRQLFQDLVKLPSRHWTRRA